MAQGHSKFNFGNTDLSMRILDEVMRRETEEGPGKATVHLVLNHSWTASGKPFLIDSVCPILHCTTDCGLI
jgi:hypothetical protein